jgi:hypothetical protein
MKITAPLWRDDREPQWHPNASGGRAIPKPYHQNTSSEREDQGNLKEGHQMLLVGGRTTKVQHSAIRILLAGGRTVQVSTHGPMPSEYYQRAGGPSRSDNLFRACCKGPCLSAMTAKPEEKKKDQPQSVLRNTWTACCRTRFNNNLLSKWASQYIIAHDCYCLQSTNKLASLSWESVHFYDVGWPLMYQWVQSVAPFAAQSCACMFDRDWAKMDVRF